MAEDTTSVDDRIELTSKLGRKYYVSGVPDGVVPPVDGEAKVGSDVGSVFVQWPVVNPRKDILTPDLKDRCGIVAYALTDTIQSPNNGKYTLYVQNNEAMKYVFTDAEGDEYNLTCVLSRWHYVEYDSNHPEIILVTWSDFWGKEAAGR